MTGGNAEERLAAALRAAVADVPEAGFDHESVVAGSRRLARRRQVLIGGGVAAAAVALVGGIAVAGLGGGGAEPTTAAAPAADSARGAQQGAPPVAVLPEAGSALQGSGQEYAAPAAPPLGPSDPTGCTPVQDPALRELVNRLLPEAAGAAEAPTTLECRPGGGREVHLEVGDGEFTGLLSVVYTAPGAELTEWDTPVGWVRSQAPTASGGTVSVTSRADADSGGVPFADRVPQLASALAPLL